MDTIYNISKGIYKAFGWQEYAKQVGYAHEDHIEDIIKDFIYSLNREWYRASHKALEIPLNKPLYKRNPKTRYIDFEMGRLGAEAKVRTSRVWTSDIRYKWLPKYWESFKLRVVVLPDIPDIEATGRKLLERAKIVLLTIQGFLDLLKRLIQSALSPYSVLLDTQHKGIFDYIDNNTWPTYDTFNIFSDLTPKTDCLRPPPLKTEHERKERIKKAWKAIYIKKMLTKALKDDIYITWCY